MALEKTLERPLDCKEIQPVHPKGDQSSILKEISPGCSLEGMMLKLKLQYFGHLLQTVDSLEKTVMLGGIGGRRRRGRQRIRWLDGITDSMDMVGWTLGVGDGQGGLACCSSWGHKELDRTERLNWTELNWYILSHSEMPKSKCAARIPQLHNWHHFFHFDSIDSVLLFGKDCLALHSGKTYY